MTREEWLRHAVEQLDSVVFSGDLDLLNHQFQINCGKCSGQKLTETIQPYDGEDVQLDDFFPTTISVSHLIKDPMEILIALTYECIKAFFNESKINKRFKSLVEKYYFEKPYKDPHPSEYLKELLNQVHKKLIKNYGEFPGTPVVIHKKELKEHKKNSFKIFCPSCGYEMKVSKKMLEKHGGSLPTCACGTKMGIDYEEGEQKENQ